MGAWRLTWGAEPLMPDRPKSIFIAVPVHGGVVPQFMETLYSAMMTANSHGLACYLCMLKGESFIARARNNLAALYYHLTDYDYLCFLDSDLEIGNCLAGDNLFAKLVGHDVDFVGGLYSARREYGRDPEGRQYLHCTSVLLDRATPCYDSGLARVRWLSGGCWLMKRSALTRLWESVPKYDGDGQLAGRDVASLFNEYQGDGSPGCYNLDGKWRYLSEDYAFCQRWLDLGGEIWADTAIRLGHWGMSPFWVWGK